MLLTLFTLGSSQCSNDQISALMTTWTSIMTYDEDNGEDPTCLQNCQPVEEEEEEEERRRKEDEDESAGGFEDMPDSGNIFTTFNCYCSTCMSDLQALKTACSECPAMTFEYDKDTDENLDDDYFAGYDDGADPDDFAYATYCTLNSIIALEKVDNFCGVFTGVSSGCLQATENLVLVEVEKENSQEDEDEDEDEDVEYETKEDDLKDCWSSPFAASSNTELNSCGDTCELVGAQTCGVEMLMDDNNTPNGIGVYGVGCFASACDEDEASMILEALKDVYSYAQFLEGVDAGEDRQSSDDDATDGLDLPTFSSASWKCTGDAGSGSDGSAYDDFIAQLGGEHLVGMVMFGFMFLVSCCMCSYYYKQTKDLLEEPLCPPWSSNPDDHERLTEDQGEGDKNYGSSNQKDGNADITV